jgi:hypothetical protein
VTIKAGTASQVIGSQQQDAALFAAVKSQGNRGIFEPLLHL